MKPWTERYEAPHLTLLVHSWDEIDPYRPVLENEATGERVSISEDEPTLAYARHQIGAIRLHALRQYAEGTPDA